MTQINRQLPLSRQLAILAKLYYGALAKRLETYDLDRHYSLLIVIDKFPGPCSQQQVADMLKVDKATMVRMVDCLVQKGYINRAVNPKDRREYFIEMTEKAQEILPHVYEAISDLNSAALKGMSNTEESQFRKWLCMMSDNLLGQPATEVEMDFKLKR